MIDNIRGEFSDLAPKKSRIGIKISKKFAMCREGQLLLWMTCNLICRLKGIVSEVEVCVPSDVQASMPKYVPFGSALPSLKAMLSDALARCSRDCHVTFANNDLQSQLDAVILIGQDTTTHAKAGFAKNVTCNGWMTYVGNSKDLHDLPCPDGRNPFGAFAGACIIVGEVFKFVNKMNPEKGDFIDKLCFSTYDLGCHERSWERLKNPSMDRSVDLGCLHVCGAGAVAHAFCQAIFPIEGIEGNLFFIDRSKDPDYLDETIESTNLARYIMAANCDEGESKAELLAKRMSTVGFQSDSSDEGLEAHINHGVKSFSHVISCVDNNNARHAIQEQIPNMIHGGSTLDLRSQVSVYDLSCGNCQCLKCYNSNEDRPSDDEIRQMLKEMSSEQRKASAVENNLDYEVLEHDLQDSACGSLSSEYAQIFSKLDDEVEFSVNFVSTLTGILLAAEIVKAKSQSLKTTLDGHQKMDLYYSFLTNTCHLATTYPRPACWCNNGKTTPRDIHRHTWTHSA